MIDRNAAKFIAAAGLVAIAGNAAKAGGDVPASHGEDVRATRVLAEGQHARKAPKAVTKSPSKRADAAKAQASNPGSAPQAIASAAKQARANAPAPTGRRVVITSLNSAMRDKATQPPPRVQQRAASTAPVVAQAPVALPKAKPTAPKTVTRSSAQMAQGRHVTRSSDAMRDNRAVGKTSQQIREGREITRSSQQMRENAPKPTRTSSQRASAEKLDVSGVRETTPRRIVIRSANARG